MHLEADAGVGSSDLKRQRFSLNGSCKQSMCMYEEFAKSATKLLQYPEKVDHSLRKGNHKNAQGQDDSAAAGWA